MSFKVVSIFLCLIIYQVHSELDFWSLTSDVSKDHPGQCWIKESNVLIDEDTKYYPKGKCVRYYCHRGVLLIGVGCLEVEATPGCKVVDQDLTKQHPDCCQKLDCEKF